MTVFNTAYDTTACRGFNIGRTQDALARAAIDGQLGQEPELNIHLVQGGSAVVDDVPAFAHPMLYKDALKSNSMAIDCRTFGRWNPDQREFNVRNSIEYSLMLRRAQLNQLWLSHSPATLRDISPAPMAIFSAWISENIARRFALDPKEQLDLSILAAIYYNSLFLDGSVKELEEADKIRLGSAIGRNLRVQVKDVLARLDEVSYIDGVADFCNTAINVTQSVRLKELNSGLLFAILGGTWYGANARETVAVALEHPPTWLAILMAAYTERTFKNSGITKLTERNGVKDSGKDFLRATLHLIEVGSR